MGRLTEAAGWGSMLLIRARYGLSHVREGNCMGPKRGYQQRLWSETQSCILRRHRKCTLQVVLIQIVASPSQCVAAAVVLGAAWAVSSCAGRCMGDSSCAGRCRGGRSSMHTPKIVLVQIVELPFFCVQRMHFGCMHTIYVCLVCTPPMCVPMCRGAAGGQGSVPGG